jgi:hypothetical protein
LISMRKEGRVLGTRQQGLQLVFDSVRVGHSGTSAFRSRSIGWKGETRILANNGVK